MSAGDIFVTDADRRIAELEAENTAYLRAYEKMAKENQRLQDAAQAVVDRMRGSGGINPDAAAALFNLAVVLEGEHENNT